MAPKLAKIILALLVLTGLIALTGCGGDDDGEETLTTITEETTEGPVSSEDYAIEAQTILVGFATRFQALGTEIGSASEAEFGGLVDQAETDIRTVIDEFDAIEPPEEAQKGHDQILAALEDFSSKLTDVSDAADGGSQSELRGVVTDLQAAAIDFQGQLLTAAETLNEAGIELGPASGAASGG